jgi:hypothetical protein
MIDISTYTVTGDNVILKFDKEDYFSIYSKKVKTSSGGIITFDFDTYYSEETKEFKYARETAEVIAIGKDVKLCQVGDTALLDYMVDMDFDNVLFEDHKTKIVFLKEGNVVQTESHGVWSSTGVWSPIWSAGDTTQFSNIIGVIRDNNIICNNEYVIYKFEDVDNQFELSQSGIWLPKEDKTNKEMVHMTIEFCAYDSKYKVGDVVSVYKNYLFTKNIQCNAFMASYEQDIWGVLN